MLTAVERAVWWGPPAMSQDSVAVEKLGAGFQTALATGSLGNGASGGTISMSFATSRNLSPRSRRPTTKPWPAMASKTSRTGSERLPMPSGKISQLGLPAAMEGHISSMWAPRTFGSPGPR